MNLSPMRFKSYVWPHNPRIYECTLRRRMASRPAPFGDDILQDMGREHGVLRGDGEFCGEGAYNEFQKLCDVFADDAPGVLEHPVWGAENAYFVELALRQEPAEDYVAYSFEFWAYSDKTEGAGLTPVPSDLSGAADGRAGERYYTVVRGDCLFTIAAKYGVATAELIRLNPQIKNPNLIYAGDLIRLP